MNAIGVKVSKNQKCNFTPTSNAKSRDLKVFGDEMTSPWL